MYVGWEEPQPRGNEKRRESKSTLSKSNLGEYIHMCMSNHLFYVVERALTVVQVMANLVPNHVTTGREIAETVLGISMHGEGNKGVANVEGEGGI